MIVKCTQEMAAVQMHVALQINQAEQVVGAAIAGTDQTTDIRT